MPLDWCEIKEPMHRKNLNAAIGKWSNMGHTPNTAGTFRKKFRKNSGKTPETLSERFLEFPSRVRLGPPKLYNSMHLKAPEHFQNSLPPPVLTLVRLLSLFAAMLALFTRFQLPSNVLPGSHSFAPAISNIISNTVSISDFSSRPWRYLPPTWAIHMATRRPIHNTPIHMDLVPFKENHTRNPCGSACCGLVCGSPCGSLMWEANIAMAC